MVIGPIILTGAKELGVLERKAAMKFYSKINNRQKAFEGYKVYGDESVKFVLNQLFKNKCAYCEMDYGGAPLESEHFRPKGAIREYCEEKKRFVRVRPGYYWLAATWENLLPSCIDCNRRRTHDFEEGARVSGKGEYFPIAVGSKRARTPGQQWRERALLIDPTKENPEKLLSFSREGLVSPRFNSGEKHDRAKATIETFGLQRLALVNKRERHAIKVMDTIQRINRSVSLLEKNPSSKKGKKEFEQAMKLLDMDQADDAPFLALTRCLVRNFMAEV